MLKVFIDLYHRRHFQIKPTALPYKLELLFFGGENAILLSNLPNW